MVRDSNETLSFHSNETSCPNAANKIEQKIQHKSVDDEDEFEEDDDLSVSANS